MGSYKQDLPLIPMDSWRTRATCTARLGELLWDDQVEDESDTQRRDRHRKAKAVCNHQCPVRQQCADSVDPRIDDGVRGGHVLPSLFGHHTPREDELARLLRRGVPLDEAAGAATRAARSA